MKKLYIAFTFLAGVLLISCSSQSDGGPVGTEETELLDVEITVSPSGAGIISPSADSSYEAEENISLRADAEEEYLFSGWTGDLEETDNPLSITVDQNYSLTANFEKKSYELVIDTEGEGSVAEKIVQTKDYEHGTVVELQAEPADEWYFVEWDGDLSGTDNPIQTTMEEPKEGKAVFKPLFTLHENGVTILCPEAEPGQKGSVDGTEYEAVDLSALEEKISSGEDVSAVCTSNIEDMSALFRYEDTFDDDISSWDVSSVTNMFAMFNNADSFNGDLSNWDVSKVTSMRAMFYHASNFDGDISSWDVSSVSNLNAMFYDATNFNGDLSNWDLSEATDMGYMFYEADSFNRDIGGWDVSSVTTMDFMFRSAGSFNQDISSWCVEQIDSKPTDFDLNAAFEGNDSYQPNWGTCPTL